MNVSKKLSSLALAALLPAAALAQADAPKPTVTVYGTINVNLQSTEATGATVPAGDIKSRMMLSNDSSNIGVRASIKVNDMIGGVAQCETSAAVSGISPSSLCNRNSRVGLTGDWGTLFFGNWDTPYKASAYGTKADDPFGNTDVYDAAALMTSPGVNTKAGAFVAAIPSSPATSVTSFSLRAQNSVVYHSPKWNGLSGKIAYSVDQFKSNNDAHIDPSLLSLVVNYEWNALSVFATYEMHKDAFGLNVLSAANGGTPAFGTAAVPRHTTDSGIRGGAGYELVSPAGATTLGVQVEQLTYTQDGATVAGTPKEYSRMAYQVALKHRYQEHEFRARFNSNDKGSVKLFNLATPAGATDGAGATMLTVGYAYYFTPALQGYAYYAKINNDKFAQYAFATGGYFSATAAPQVAAGADPQAIGIGARFAF
jgi:predicted porin